MRYEAVIVGAGPVGMMLACELKLSGVSVIVIEQLSEPDPTIKAGSINIPSVEAFYRRGMLPGLTEAQERNIAQLREFAQERMRSRPERRLSGKFAWHFSGIGLDATKLDHSDPEFGGRGPAIGGALVPQQAIEALLSKRAHELKVDVRRGVRMTGLDIHDDGVVVNLADGAIHADWLVGCDGGRSMVRKRAGFDFVGTDPETTGHQARVEIEDPEKLGCGWIRTATGVYTHGPHPGRILTVEFDSRPGDRDTPVTLEDLQSSLRNASGTDVTLTAVRSNPTRFSDHARQATTYRRGRVLLAGDAAHVHSPFGGQGLNLGIGDAVNLGWKLAATIKGWACTGLLDTYTTERHPIGAWVLDWTRAQSALMRTDPASRALCALMEELVELPAVVTHLMKKIAGTWQRYDLPGEHPLIGRSAPDLLLDDGRRLGDCCHDGRAMLFDFSEDGGYATMAHAWSDRLNIVCSQCAENPEIVGLLVRPDGCVAWAASVESNSDSLHSALLAWLGQPEPLNLRKAANG